MFIVVTIFADTAATDVAAAAAAAAAFALFPTDELLHQAHDLLRKMMGTTAMEKIKTPLRRLSLFSVPFVIAFVAFIRDSLPFCYSFFFFSSSG